MLKIDRQQGSLVAYAQPVLEPGRLATRHRLDDLIVASPDAFFADLRRPLFLLGRLSDFSPAADRSMVLAADPLGRVTVMAFQAESGAPPDLVEALQAAESISGWGGPEILACLSPLAGEQARSRLRGGPETLNREQSVMLLAESFDADALATSAWLTQRYGVPADCLRVSLAFDQRSSDEYLLIEDLGAEAEALHFSGWADLDPTPWPDAVPDISDAPPASEEAERVPDSRAQAAREPRTVEEPAVVSTVPPSPLISTSPDWEAEFKAAMEAPAEAEPQKRETVEPEAAEAEVAEADVPEVEAAAKPIAVPASPPTLVEPESKFEELIPDLELDDDFEDPLADVIEAREHAEEAASAPREPGAERREAERTDAYQARRLRLNYFGRLLGARLVDYSDKGIGVEALSPLPVGAEIGVSGELVSDEKVVALEGRARVRHAKPNSDGVCRIGFSLDPSVVKELDTPETFERR